MRPEIHLLRRTEEPIESICYEVTPRNPSGKRGLRTGTFGTKIIGEATIERIRAALCGGSPNTINPLLDSWWKNLSARLDSGPAALHRLPESVAHVAEALWMQALDEGRRRAQLELKSTQRAAAEQQQNLEVRSHVLTLREGELDARLRDREITITELNLQLRELTLLLRKEQANRESLSRQIAELQSVRVKKQDSSRSGKSVTQKRREKTPQRAASKRPKGRKRLR